ncbi:MAG: nitroreductase family protein [Candidatus Caldarchaeum sp.]|nr:nitroreductase family protein [Candidatus Caldarchaeum sp.]MCS7133658.1 nitroreductase family protein [Candidatus Caldarchaeum sp.]MDW8063873.1 nitroreductase family protein [Candidatus Caldarchaeum sp.]MDW8435230.1 nitroreductase family protein [Candidatus Caldarchaeum sp.]
MDVIDFIRGRRSSKNLGAGHVPFEIVVKAVQAGVWAANAHNSQPWRFVVVSDEEVKKRLLDEMGKEWLEDLIGDGIDAEKALKIIESSNGRSMKAAYLVVVCLTMADMDVYWDSKRSRCEYLMAVQSVAAAVQNMLLALHGMGYGACWRCSPLFAPDAVRRVLQLPNDVEPMALVEIGHRGGETTGTRKPLSDVVFLNRWGEHLR